MPYGVRHGAHAALWLLSIAAAGCAAEGEMASTTPSAQDDSGAASGAAANAPASGVGGGLPDAGDAAPPADAESDAGATDVFIPKADAWTDVEQVEVEAGAMRPMDCPATPAPEPNPLPVKYKQSSGATFDPYIQFVLNARPVSETYLVRDLEFRYYFTDEAGASGSETELHIGYASVYSDDLYDNARLGIVRLDEPTCGADSYLSLTFEDTDVSLPPEKELNLAVHVISKGSAYNERNDFSHYQVDSLALWDRVTAYYQGVRISGTPPAPEL